VNTTHTAGIIPPKVLVEKTNKMPVTENKTSTECLIDTNTSAYNNFSKQNTVSKDTYKPLQGEITMAEVDTNMLSSQHADIRREAAMYAGETRYDIASSGSDIRREVAASTDTLNDSIRVEGGNTRTASAFETNEIIKESIKGDWHNSDAIKDSRYDIATRVEDAADRVRTDIGAGMASLSDKFFTVARDTADLRAQVIQAIDTTKLATELNALKGIIEGQRNTTYLSDKISLDGEKTRGLINDLKFHDLNRGLIERNAELVEERAYGRHWRDYGSQNQYAAQFAQLQSQMQNFNSQLADTRQGMVNFGTMAGNSGQQTSTANNVR
jgi:ubiquinone biosynthesis protein UbiJ